MRQALAEGVLAHDDDLLVGDELQVLVLKVIVRVPAAVHGARPAMGIL